MSLIISNGIIGSVAIGGTMVSGGTPGSVLFVDASGNLGQDNANLFWDDTNNRLGIGTNSPSLKFQVETNTNSSDGLFIRNINSGNLANSIMNTNSDAGQLSTVAYSSGHGVWPSTGNIFTSSGLTGGFNLLTSTNAPLAFWTNSTQRITILGTGNVGINASSPGASLQVTCGSSSTIGQIIKGASSQSADLTEWQNSAGSILAKFNSSGELSLGNSTIPGSVQQSVNNSYVQFLGSSSAANGAGFYMAGNSYVGDGITFDGGWFSMNQGTNGVFRIANISDVEWFRITNAGRVGIGVLSPGGQFQITIGASTTIGQIIKAAASQSAHVFETQNSSGTVRVAIDDEGRIGIREGPYVFYGLIMGGTTAASSVYSSFWFSQNHNGGGTQFGFGGAPNILVNTDVCYAGYLSVGTDNSAITLGEAYRLFLAQGTKGAASTVTDNYGLYVASMTYGSTHNYAIYTNAGLNSFGDNVGIGQTNPTALLHLKAGTTAAGTAPIKFTSGTSMTTAEAGTVEFTTDDLFFTITTGAARKAFILDNGSRLTSGKIPIATTNGRLIDLTASSAYTPSNVTTDRSYDANATSLDELADVVGTIIADLQAKGILG